MSYKTAVTYAQSASIQAGMNNTNQAISFLAQAIEAMAKQLATDTFNIERQLSALERDVKRR